MKKRFVEANMAKIAELDQDEKVFSDGVVENSGSVAVVITELIEILEADEPDADKIRSMSDSVLTNIGKAAYLCMTRHMLERASEVWDSDPATWALAWGVTQDAD